MKGTSYVGFRRDGEKLSSSANLTLSEGGGDRQCKLNRTSCIIGGFCISHAMGWGAFPSCKKGVGLTFSVGFPIHRERLKFRSSSRGELGD